MLNPQSSDLDQEFINLMLQIEQNYGAMNKHSRIRIELWTKKLCQVTTNDVWKKNRNLYSKILLNQVIKQSLSEPFDKRPSEGPLPKLNKYSVNFSASNLKENRRQSFSKPLMDNTQNALNQRNTNYQGRNQSPYGDEDQQLRNQIQELIQQVNDQQNTIQVQQAQITQLSEFNEKLVRSVIACRQYLDPISDIKCLELKVEQDQLFQWMQDQSQMLYRQHSASQDYQPMYDADYQDKIEMQSNQEDQYQASFNQLQQIDEQEEESDQNGQNSGQINLDLMMYLNKYEQKKGADIQNQPIAKRQPFGNTNYALSFDTINNISR